MPFYSSVHNKFNKLSTKSTESQKGFDYNGDTPNPSSSRKNNLIYKDCIIFALWSGKEVESKIEIITSYIYHIQYTKFFRKNIKKI